MLNKRTGKVEDLRSDSESPCQEHEARNYSVPNRKRVELVGANRERQAISGVRGVLRAVAVDQER